MRRDIEFLSGGVILRGFFEVPDGADGPVPVICFAHGFSGVKELFLEDISAAFAGQGFASVVWDQPPRVSAEQKRPDWKRQPGRFFNCGCALDNAERASFHSTLWMTVANATLWRAVNAGRPGAERS
jgi:hypothetical protein